MNFTTPVWALNKPCPRCGQGLSLSFNTCQKCKRIVLICTEEFSLFPDPKNLTRFEIWVDNCPTCNEECPWEFSNSEEIQALGFKVGEYC